MPSIHHSALRKSGLIIAIILGAFTTFAQTIPEIHYAVTIPDPESHRYHVELRISDWGTDTLVLKMPKWMPGYYQIMDYAKGVENVSAKDEQGKQIQFQRPSDNAIFIVGLNRKTLVLNYDVITSRKFVATSYVDAGHGYLITGNSFFFPEGYINLPVNVVIENAPWPDIATGLDNTGKPNEFFAPNFDILYDCPILIGNLESLPSFNVSGVEHHFIGYKMGDFNRIDFIEQLEKVTTAAVNIIGDIPFEEYTFIAIGPGRGGIEHLNNTTVSFDGNSLDDPAAMNRMMNFLAHEYFHHYNVKRIRPLELGPFDYEKGSRTHLLWVSEGLSVYYEYLIVKRAGVADQSTLFENLEGNINNHENNPGRFHQSLIEASYNTWADGPFGTQGKEPGRAISYYEKGPIVAAFLDFAIRNATENEQSLDDVMKHLYWKYYKGLNRGFTDAEFQQTCDEIAGASLSEVFEYVYTTEELNYGKFLGYAGLALKEVPDPSAEVQKRKFKIVRTENPSPLQSKIFKSWLGE